MLSLFDKKSAEEDILTQVGRGNRGLKKLYNQELRKICWSRMVSRVIESRRKRCMLHVVPTGDRVGAYRIGR